MKLEKVLSPEAREAMKQAVFAREFELAQLARRRIFYARLKKAKVKHVARKG